ncbi:PVC-type heme-binding CxxCH protein [Prosthecobacter vanneervenii]|uniref:Mono/diheme cytochrome c family protein/glucose/arabinose dehydrogenase n=1 Tax=Prosthecobacter vanneervenii TaxID=48466 RepID=A0A7W7YDT5_9BACT|nr:PVC-type heme-binding CxxCH protein [Prosthecobacter vanneervenii]MBB5034345.1 mono/diheme cytochrome c family protein/glucose/arabinose dehydrogenase [Prosthecobacter vanneervenii]
MPSPRFTTLTSLLLLTTPFLTPALAINEKNAGPEKVELKFKLPPPTPLSWEEEMKTFKIEKGFRIELVASEPMIESPIAVSFDDQGRLYVVEMRGYMHDLAGAGETEPTGRISLLEDTDGDGRMDKATAFLDKLVMPRAVMAVNGGVLVAEPPNLLFCKDTDGDGKADVKEVVTSDYGTLGGQPEHMANTPVWAMDNAIWSAGYSTRFKLRGGVWQKDSGLGRGQWGLCQDNYGRLYFNYNSDMLRADLLPTEAFTRNPLLRNASSINAKVAADQTLFPSHPTPGVNRGYDPKSLRADGTLTKPTGTCGALIYRGDAFPAAYRGNAFIPEPCANLVKRFTMSENDGIVKATNTAKTTEFLTSTDERFRPVNAADGPDGALYIVDMYRGIIQHQSFLTHYLIANIKDRKLETPFNQGRIWRIVPDTKERPQPVKVSKEAKMLTHANGWVRDTAQRLIVESSDSSAIPSLKELLASDSPITRLHALWTLDGLSAATPDLLRTALTDKDAQVRAAAVRISGRDLAPDLIALTSEKDALVLAHLAIKLTSFNLPDADTAVAKLLSINGKNALVREGALTGLRGREAAFAKLLAAQLSKSNSASITPVIEALGALLASANKAGPFEDMLELAAAQPQGGAIQVAAIKGLATSSADPKSKTTPKLLWLEAEPATLKTLKTAMTDKTSAKLFTSVEARLAWPGKPGAPPPPKIVPLNEAQTALYEKGKTIYATLCAACHQPHGFGLDGLAPPLVDSEWVLGKAELPARIIMHGLAGPVKVGGRSFNLAMPPLPQLTDEDVAGVLTYIRREWEHNASPVDTKAVTAIRTQTKGRTVMWTEQELKNLGKKPSSK